MIYKSWISAFSRHDRCLVSGQAMEQCIFNYSGRLLVGVGAGAEVAAGVAVVVAVAVVAGTSSSSSSSCSSGSGGGRALASRMKSAQ